MARTIHRTPMTNNTDLAEDIKYGYANFASFKGICDDKNYIGIDQQTLEDANNMYIDDDDQLSSRPKLKQMIIDILPDNYTIIKIYNVHGIVVYHIKDTTSNKYMVYLKYDNKPFDHECGEHLNIGWFIDKLYFFTDDTIFAFGDSNWYNAEQIIYIPVTEQVIGGVKYTHYNEGAIEGKDIYIDDKNLFTSSYITRYILDENVNAPLDDLDGETVTITVAGVTYKIVWSKYTPRILVTNIFQIAVDNAITNDKGQIVAYNSDRPDILYYKDIGDVFIRLPNIENYTNYSSTPVLTQDGSWLTILIITALDGDNYPEKSTLIGIDLRSTPYQWTTLAEKELNRLTSITYNGDVTIYNQSSSTTSHTWTNPSTTYRYGREAGRAVGYGVDVDKLVFMRPARYYMSVVGDTTFYDVYGYNVYTFNGNELFDFFDNGIGCVRDSGFSNSVNLSRPFNFRVLTRGNRTQLIINTYNGQLSTRNNFHIITLDDKMKPFVVKVFTAIYTSSSNAYYVGYRYHSGLIETSSNLYSDIANDFASARFDYENGPLVNTFTLVGTPRTAQLNIYKDDVVVTLNTTSDISGSISLLSPINKNLNAGTQTNIDSQYGNTGAWYTYIEEPKQTISRIAVSDVKINELRASIVDDNLHVLTDNYLFVNDTRIDLLMKPIRPISANWKGDGVLYIYDNVLYGVDTSKRKEIDVLHQGEINPLIPSFIQEFINTDNVIAFENKIGWTTSIVDENRYGKLYVSMSDIEKFPTEVTGLILLSQTEVAIFFENEIRIFTYTDNGYIIQRSKLQLGCKKGNDVILNYDGSTTLLCTLKGLSALTYQDFVQSTDQVFSYLSENIIGAYDKFSDGALKLYQYKNWIVMYRQDKKYCYIFDLRNSSWWKWSCNHFIQQIIYDNNNLIIVIDGKPNNLITDNGLYYDFGHEIIEWFLRSQKLHFDAPNNYKHVNQFIITSTQTDIEPFKLFLKFICYRNLIDTTRKEAYDYEVNGLKTFIKRINFMKINAFQFEVSNYKRQNIPKQFTTPNIAIKYRITERIR